MNFQKENKMKAPCEIESLMSFLLPRISAKVVTGNKIKARNH